MENYQYRVILFQIKSKPNEMKIRFIKNNFQRVIIVYLNLAMKKCKVKKLMSINIQNFRFFFKGKPFEKQIKQMKNGIIKVELKCLQQSIKNLKNLFIGRLMKKEQLNIAQKKNISLVNRVKQNQNPNILSQPNNQQINNSKISLRSNLTKKSYKAPTVDRNELNQNNLDKSSQKYKKIQNQIEQYQSMQRDQQQQLNRATIFHSFKNINEDKQSNQQNNERNNEQKRQGQNPTTKLDQNFQNISNYNRNVYLSGDASIIGMTSVSSHQKKFKTPSNQISTKNQSFFSNTNQYFSANPNLKFQTQNNSATHSHQACSIQGYENSSQHENQKNFVHKPKNNYVKNALFRHQQPLNYKNNPKNNNSSSFHQVKNRKTSEQFAQSRQKQFSTGSYPKNLGAPIIWNQTHNLMNPYKNQQSQQNNQINKSANNHHGPERGLNFIQNTINNDAFHSHSNSIPSFLTKKINLQQCNKLMKQPQRNNSIKRINGVHQIHNKNQINENDSKTGTNDASNYNTNAKQSMTVRDLEYGRKIQAQQRTKSHTKNYSNAQVMNLPVNTVDTDNFLGKSPKFENSHYQEKPREHNIFENDKSLSRYMINITNKSNYNQKNYVLDSIAQKDQFSKVIARDRNGNNDERRQLRGNSSLMHRQKQSSNYSSSKKFHVVLDSTNHPIVKSSSNEKSGLSRNSSQAHPYFLNLNSIKRPTNGEQRLIQQNRTICAQRVTNEDKYSKLNHEPFNNQNLYRPNDKYQNNSANSSFKSKKSETSSMYHNTQNRGTKTTHQKPFSATNYPRHQQNQQVRQQNDIAPQYKYQRRIPPQIYSSNKNLHANSQERKYKQKSGQKFARTLDFDIKIPQFLVALPQRKQTHSFGFGQKRLYHYDQHANNKNRGVISNNFQMQPEIRLNSPGHKMTRPRDVETNNMKINSPQCSENKVTNLSPSHKNMKSTKQNHFITQEQSNGHKKSIKKMLVSQSKNFNPKSQILFSLNFNDLKGKHHQSHPSSKTLLEVLTKNQLTKMFCSTFRIGQNQNGCDCVPKCYWVERWLQKIKINKYTNTKSLIPRHDRNSIRQNMSNLNSLRQNPGNHNNLRQSPGDQNIFKNTYSKQTFTFGDVYDSSNPDQVQTFKQIQKDIPRTCSDHPTFKKQKYRDFLRQLLINVYYLDKKLGYVQGMNIIGAGLVYHSKSVYQAVKLMDFMMNVLNYRKLFENDMSKCRQISKKTCKIIRHYCYDMYNFVSIQNQVDLQIFIMGWYFSMLGSFVPLQSMHFVINKFIEKQFTGIMEIIVTYFIFIKDVLMQKDDPNEIMQELSIQAMIQRSKKIDWNQLISLSDKLRLSLDQQDL